MPSRPLPTPPAARCIIPDELSRSSMPCSSASTGNCARSTGWGIIRSRGPPQGVYRQIEVRVKGDYTVRYRGSPTIPAVRRNERRNPSLMNLLSRSGRRSRPRRRARSCLRSSTRPPKISYKGEVDIVTQADRRSEEAVVTRLRTHFPTHAIVAEEGGGQETDSPFRWLVDPLDGTTNFAHGYPCFAVSIGLEEAGELIVGAIYQPVTQGAVHAPRRAKAPT